MNHFPGGKLETSQTSHRNQPKWREPTINYMRALRTKIYTELEIIVFVLFVRSIWSVVGSRTTGPEHTLRKFECDGNIHQWLYAFHIDIGTLRLQNRKRSKWARVGSHTKPPTTTLPNCYGQAAKKNVIW